MNLVIVSDVCSNGPCGHVSIGCSHVLYGYAFGVVTNLCISCMADATFSCSLNITRSRHEKDGTYTGHLLRSTHHYGDVSFIHVDSGTNIAPTPSRTHLVRPSTPVIPVELGSGKEPRGPTDHYDLVPLGSADPYHPEPFTSLRGAHVSDRVRRTRGLEAWPSFGARGRCP